MLSIHRVYKGSADQATHGLMLCFADKKYVGLVVLRIKYLFPNVTKYELPQLIVI